MPKETASFEDDCQQKTFQSKDGQQLDGTFCECGSDGCNESSKIVPSDKVFFLLMSLMYIRKLILSKIITSNYVVIDYSIWDSITTKHISFFYTIYLLSNQIQQYTINIFFRNYIGLNALLIHAFIPLHVSE